MSEQIGTFELDHVCNTYTTGPNNEITNHTNWRGTAEGMGQYLERSLLHRCLSHKWMRNWKAERSAGLVRVSMRTAQ